MLNANFDNVDIDDCEKPGFVYENTNYIYLKAISINLKNLEYLDLCLKGCIRNNTFNLFFNEWASSLKSLKIDIAPINYYSLQLSIHELTLLMDFSNLRAFCKMFRNVKFEKLECLKFNFLGCYRESTRGFLMAIPENCPNLTNLVITECAIPNEDLDVLKNLSKLSSLRVKNCHNISKEYFEELFGEIGYYEEEDINYQNFLTKHMLFSTAKML